MSTTRASTTATPPSVPARCRTSSCSTTTGSARRLRESHHPPSLPDPPPPASGGRSDFSGAPGWAHGLRRRWCEDYDRLTATNSSGDSTTIPYTVAHYGPRLPVDGLRLDLAITQPYDACAALTSVSRGGDISALGGGPVDGSAFLSSVRTCEFIYKAMHAEQFGASMTIVANEAEQIFYMAATPARQSDALALDIPSILIGFRGNRWLTNQLAGGVLIEIGGDQSRCSGGRTLTDATGIIRSGPPGQRYCSWQQCQWHVAIPTDDVIVVTFSRFSLECMTTHDGTAYDYVRLYDGATDLAPRLATFFCTTYQTVVTTDRHLFVHFATDDLFNYDGFSATYSTGVLHCGGHSTCSACSANPHCAWCLESHLCLPSTGPQAVCTASVLTGPDSAPWARNATECCDVGWSGAQCTVCAPGYYGATCAPCACASPGGTCNDGISGDGACTCSTGWDGTLCDACSADHWGANCTACGCQGSSTCDTGVNGTGCECLADYYGPQCVACPCTGNARCNAGISGSGSCACDPGFTGVSSGCNACASGRYGATCAACDCPSHTNCEEGISGTGRCNCNAPSCEEDASLVFMELIATAQYDVAAGPPYRHLPFGTSFAPAQLEYGTVILPDQVESLDVIVAPSQWGSRIALTVERNGVATTMCDALLDANQASPPNLQNASAAAAILAGTPTVWSLPSTSSRLLRACTLTPLKGNTSLTLTVTSPGGLVLRAYTTMLSFPPSDDCRLSSLAFAYRNSAAVSSNAAFSTLPIAPSRPDFSPATYQYNAALSEDALELDIVGATMHGARCAGVYDGARCLRAAALRLEVVSTSAGGHSSPVTQASDGQVYSDSLAVRVQVPSGSSVVILTVEPESQESYATCTYNLSLASGLLGVTEYRVQVGFSADGDVADFPSSRMRAIGDALATQASVDPSRVNVFVSGGSVNVMAHIFSTSSTASSAVQSALAGVTASSSALSTFLAASPAGSVTVLSSPSIGANLIPLISSIAAAGTSGSGASSSAELEVGALAASSGATGAAAFTLFPELGDLNHTLAHEETSVTLAPTVASGATFTLDCAACSALPVGDTVATMVVTAQDLTHVAIVTIVVTRMPSRDCTLASLSLMSDPAGGGSSGLLPGSSSTLSEVASWSGLPAGRTFLHAAIANEHLWLRVSATPSAVSSSIRYRFGIAAANGWQCSESTCAMLPTNRPSLVYDLPIASSYLHMTVAAQAGDLCTYRVALERARSTDTALRAINASLIVNNRVDSTTRIAVTALATSMCPSGAHTCHAIDLLYTQVNILFRAYTNHSRICPTAAHACLRAASVSLTAPSLSWAQYGTESGTKGILEAIMTVPVGNTAVMLTVTAEDPATSQQRHYVILRRQASLTWSDTTLRSLTVFNADLLTGFRMGVQRRRFDVAMHTNQMFLRITAAGPAGSRVTVRGTSMPVTIEIANQPTSTIDLEVRAEDTVTATNYTIVITCRHCNSTLDSETDDALADEESDQDLAPSWLGSSVWLMIVLLIAATTLCCLSLLVCMRMQCLRSAQRRALMRRPPPMPQLSAGEVLTRLAPYLTQIKGRDEDSPLADETCAICLGELEPNDELTLLPCHHAFHMECISGWLVHKGLAAPCPLCKRHVAPDLLEPYGHGGGRRDATQAGVELQILDPVVPAVDAAAELPPDVNAPEEGWHQVVPQAPAAAPAPASRRASSNPPRPRQGREILATPVAWADSAAENSMAPRTGPPPSPPASAAASSAGSNPSSGAPSERSQFTASPFSSRSHATRTMNAQHARIHPASPPATARSEDGEGDENLIQRVGTWIRGLTPTPSPSGSRAVSPNSTDRPLGAANAPAQSQLHRPSAPAPSNRERRQLPDVAPAAAHSARRLPSLQVQRQPDLPDNFGMAPEDA